MMLFMKVCMIYFNCDGFGHVKLNCPYQQIFPTEKSTIDNLEEENKNMEKPNPDPAIMTESISSPMLCQNSSHSSGHSPWILMS